MQQQPRTTHHPAFTAVELMVVISIVIALLVVGLPAFNQMRTEAERGQARQAINTALQQAYILAKSTRTITAVRFVPAAWEYFDNRLPDVSDQQVIAIYQMRFSMSDPTNLAGGSERPNLSFNQRFELVSDYTPVTLPTGLWVAPIEAIDRDISNNRADGLLTGNFGAFAVDAVSESNAHLDCDDFLIVFDPETGLRPTQWQVNNANPTRGWQIEGFDPVSQRRAAWEPVGTSGQVRKNRPYQRMNFTGVILYEREPMVERVGTLPGDRANFLLQEGEQFFANPNGGGAIAVTKANQS